MNKRIINKNFRNTGTNRRRRGFRRGLFTGAAAAVVFITVYSLILPAITMERYACGLEEHQNSVDCYTDGVLTCGMTEHRHTDACRGEGASDEKSLFADMSDVTSAVTSADTSTGSSAVTTTNTPADVSADTSEEAYVVTPADTYADTSAAPSGGQVFFSNEEEADSNSSVFGFGDSSALQETGGELQDTDDEIYAETGKAEVSDNGVTISAADGSYLPEEAEASAQILREADADAAAARVEESNGTAMTGAKESNGTAMTGADESNGIPAASPKAKNAAPAAKLKAANAAPAARRKAGTAATAAAENSAPAGSVSGSDASSAETSPAAGGSAESGSAANSSAGQMSASTKYKVFDIRLEGVDEAAYADGFRVDVQLQESLTGRDFRLYHIHEGEAPLDITKTLELHFDESGASGAAAAESGTDTEKRITGFSFVTDNFSEFVLSYTVDFHYEVNGQTYEFSLPGGGFVSLTNLLEMVGIAGDTDAARKLVADVVSAEVSNPDLVWVGRADAETTVGALKETTQLACQYSAELTEEQIAEINAQTVEAGDWALISMQPFTSEEELTVTMKNGDAFTIRVTDAQITTLFLSDSGELFEVTVTYDDSANIPDGSTLKVTEFAEDDERYEYARNAVLADKKARGEWVDLNSFGLAALDISILNPAGEEIEPEAPVQVDIRIKELPGVEDLNEVANTLAIQHHVEVEDGVVVETVFDGSAEALDENADASFELETDETAAEEGIAVDPEVVSEEDFAAPEPVKTGSLDLELEVEAFSTFTISWNKAYGNGTRIHYVDESGRELTVKNTTLPATIGAYSTSPAYLIYDIEGYEYDYTYYNNANTRIYPYLFKADSGWAFYNSSGTGHYLSTNQNIYVVYKKKADIAQGGTPTVKQSGDVDPPVAPRINKESTPNGDDTNTLALSLISDTAKLEVEKLADVIVVFDVSGSMKEGMGNNTRLQAAKDAVNNLAAHLAEKKNSAGEPLVRMSLIQFSTKASTVLRMTELTNNGLQTVQTAVNGLTADGGTNWDHALQLANEENDLDSGRATFVIFVTDGDPTFRNTRMDVTDLDLQGETNDGAWKNYGVLNPNPFYLSDGVYGPADNDKTGKCYDAAVVQGRAIVSAGKNIYTIGISNDVKKVDTFNSDIQGNGAYLAADSATLQKAFADIEASISGASGWGNIKMTDGITNLSNTVQKTGLTNVGGDFTYWKAPAPENWASMTEDQKNAYKPAASDFVEWDPASEGAALAVYNETSGAVEWNMGSTFMPEGGVTYQVRFKVWPSQEAYDYIAKLNNGTIAYDSLPEEVKSQIIQNGSTYTLKTNEANANTTYQTAIKTGNNVTISGDPQTLLFPTVEDLNLSVDKMKVQKEWINDLDPDARWKSDVELLLTDGAGNLYKKIDLNEANNFTAEDNFISCGLAKIEKNELIIYEVGHDFKLTEPAEYAYYWDLDSQVYRPMIINAKLTMLMKADAPAGMGEKTYYVDDGTSYYKIEGGTYKAISTGDAAAAITATNIRRSNLNLTKKVVDEKGNPAISSDAFEFTITINDTQDADVWFSVQTDANDTSTIVKDLITNATAEEKDGEKTGYYHAPSKSEITVSIEPGWNLRFTNLPNGTTYTITENANEKYTFVSAEIDNGGTFSVNSGTTTGTGKINESNKQYTVTYTNKTAAQQVYIFKTGQDAQKPLQGAEFTLYTKEGYEAEPKTALKTKLVSDKDGKIDLGRLVKGEYRLVETKAPAGYILPSEPVEITVTKDGVQYKQITNNMSSSKEGVSGDKDTGYTLLVTNNAGYELPSTGGPGTLAFTILGSILLAAAALLQIWRSQNRQRRCKSRQRKSDR